MSNQVKLESIVHFQSIESFEEVTGLIYDDLSEEELFEALVQWHYPGEHDTNNYDQDDINSNFLGYQHSNDDRYLLSTYDSSLVIGLSYIINEAA